MSSEWPEVTVGEVSTLITKGTTPTTLGYAFQDNGVRFVKVETLSEDGQFLEDKFAFISDEAHSALSRSQLKEDDVLFTIAGTIGRTGIVDARYLPANTNQAVALVRPNKKLVAPHFLKYVLSNRAFTRNAHSKTVQSVQANFSLGELKQSRFKLPSPEEQREVLAVLGPIDNRITLLRETNATLEAIAQALFKSWFVDFDPVRAKMEGCAPEGMDDATAALFPDALEETELGPVPRGWKTGTLGDVAQTARRQLQVSDLNADLNYVGLEHVPRKSLSLTEWGNAEGLESAKAAFAEGDILFGRLRPYFHKVVVAPFSGVCSTDILVCQPIRPEYSGVVTMHLFSEALIQYADRLSNGAKMPRVSWKDLAVYPISVPPPQVAEAYNKSLQSLMDRMKANIHQAQTLATLRDTLLPRLISGQLSISDTGLQIEEAIV